MPEERKNVHGEALSAVREATRGNESGSAHSASPTRFRTCTANSTIKKSRPRRDRAVSSGQRSHIFSFGVYDQMLGRVRHVKGVED